MTAALMANPWWCWIALGGVLLIIEMLGTNGYLLWSGSAALLVGVITRLFRLPGEAQWLLFAVLTLLSALLWTRWLRRQPLPHDLRLNQRAAQLTGRIATLETPVVNGVGHARLGDSTWRVTAQQDLPAGTPVRIVAVASITLIVEPLNAEPSSPAHHRSDAQ